MLRDRKFFQIADYSEVKGHPGLKTSSLSCPDTTNFPRLTDDSFLNLLPLSLVEAAEHDPTTLGFSRCPWHNTELSPPPFKQ